MKRAFPFFGLILILIWVIACTVPESKATPTPGAIVLSDQEGWYPLGLHLEMLEDLSRNLSITQVSAPGMNAQFSPNKKATPSFGVTHSTIWARFRIDDQSQTTPYWLLAIGLPSMEHIDLFVSQKEGNFLIQRTGLLIPDSAQEIQDNHYVFKLPAGLQEGQVVYLRFETTNTMTLPLTLWSPEAFNQKERYEELMWGMFLGLMLGMAVFNTWVSNTSIFSRYSLLLNW